MLRIVTKENISAELEKILKRNSPDVLAAEQSVRAIVDDVARHGDKAVAKYTKKFDGVDLKPADFKIKPGEIDGAYRSVSGKFVSALKAAIRNIRAYHEKQKIDQWFETLPDDVVMGMRCLPIEKIGIYVPGGTAAYPSSVLMNAIPAKIAEVDEIVMVTPPGRGKGRAKVDPHILVAAAEVGISSIYRIGGAQAVAALAFGTETIPKVDKIVGPGNLYVTLAKKLVYGTVGIDKLAGPSDVVIIADERSDPEFIAADLLAQAEHDPGSSSILITTSAKIAFATQDELGRQLKKLRRKQIILKALKQNSAAFVVDSIKAAVDLSNKIAPEHLEILAASPQKVLEQVKNAGAVFLGPHSPVVVGDYIAGPNHVLPTSGSARFSSPLGVYDFIRTQSIVGYTKAALKHVKEDIKILAEVEGLDAHARAIDIRFGQ
jgi:histidinol dehydrogenase